MYGFEIELDPPAPMLAELYDITLVLAKTMQEPALKSLIGWDGCGSTIIIYNVAKFDQQVAHTIATGGLSEIINRLKRYGWMRVGENINSNRMFLQHPTLEKRQGREHWQEWQKRFLEEVKQREASNEVEEHREQPFLVLRDWHLRRLTPSERQRRQQLRKEKANLPKKGFQQLKRLRRKSVSIDKKPDSESQVDGEDKASDQFKQHSQRKSKGQAKRGNKPPIQAQMVPLEADNKPKSQNTAARTVQSDVRNSQDQPQHSDVSPTSEMSNEQSESSDESIYSQDADEQRSKRSLQQESEQQSQPVDSSEHSKVSNEEQEIERAQSLESLVESQPVNEQQPSKPSVQMDPSDSPRQRIQPLPNNEICACIICRIKAETHSDSSSPSIESSSDEPHVVQAEDRNPSPHKLDVSKKPSTPKPSVLRKPQPTTRETEVETFCAKLLQTAKQVNPRELETLVTLKDGPYQRLDSLVKIYLALKVQYRFMQVGIYSQIIYWKSSRTIVIRDIPKFQQRFIREYLGLKGDNLIQQVASLLERCSFTCLRRDRSRNCEELCVQCCSNVLSATSKFRHWQQEYSEEQPEKTKQLQLKEPVACPFRKVSVDRPANKINNKTPLEAFKNFCYSVRQFSTEAQTVSELKRCYTDATTNLIRMVQLYRNIRYRKEIVTKSLQTKLKDLKGCIENIKLPPVKQHQHQTRLWGGPKVALPLPQHKVEPKPIEQSAQQQNDESEERVSEERSGRSLREQSSQDVAERQVTSSMMRPQAEQSKSPLDSSFDYSL